MTSSIPISCRAGWSAWMLIPRGELPLIRVSLWTLATRDRTKYDWRGEMLQLILSAIPLNAGRVLHTLPELLPGLGVLAAMLAFGAYHGLNPGMGWLFALSLGLQQRSSRAIWLSLLPITLGHAAALGVVAALI